jgi:signal transduction histidine kinase
VTHELRTPLTSMRAFAEILLDNPELARPERERFLRIVVEEIERLSRLINQVLDLSKIESGRAEWDIAEVDLAEVISESATAAAQLIAAKKAELLVSVPAEVPSVPADRDRVKQVLLNLLSNAAKFCAEERGRVAVELAVEDGRVRVDVSDNGPGIEPENQEVIFDRFRQGGKTMTERPPGTGLGLPISREIIRQLGGELWVDSAPGEGSTFSFVLPRTGTVPEER